MATSKIQLTEGSGKNAATYSLTEDAVTKDISRAVLNNSSGTEIGTTSNPIQVSVANTGANTTAVKVDGSAVTQPVSISGNQAVNQTQINGNTISVGNGVSGTGVQRVAIASDNSAVSGVGVGATGSAVPSNAVYGGLNASTALPSAASAGNLTGKMGDKFGRQVVLPNSIRDLMGSQTTTISASTSETTIITAGGSGVYLDLLAVFISNTSATAARVDIRDATSGSIIFQIYVPAGDMRGITLTTPWPQTTANNNWTAQSSASVTDLRVSALFAKNK